MVNEDKMPNKPAVPPYMQNRELSWLEFNKRCLDQAADPHVPLIDRLQFVSIFWSNLQEFFMVRVGSLTDMSLLKKKILDSKTYMTPEEQLDAIYARCHELVPYQEMVYREVINDLAKEGVHELLPEDLNEEQVQYLRDYLEMNVVPFLSPQVVNTRHPFPHLINGEIYVVVRLLQQDNHLTKAERKALKEYRKTKRSGARDVTLGLIPMPRNAKRVIELPGEGVNYILLENAIEFIVPDIFNMYRIKHTNIITVTRNADIDVIEAADEHEEDYREFMKNILKRRARLVPVRLESKRPLSEHVAEFLLARLNLEPKHCYVTSVPLDVSYAFGLADLVPDSFERGLWSGPIRPAWPHSLDRKDKIIPQIEESDKLLAYPYEDINAFIRLLREASNDPDVLAIKITLYRLASNSAIAEALIAAAENGKDVTALFELRARFDESNNIDWSQRFEQAGCKVIYGFHDYKVHSKICCITKRGADGGLEYITQLGTGNYNEKTSRLYTDFSYITSDPAIGRDAVEFFTSMSLESLSTAYQTLAVAPLQIKQGIIAHIDEQIANAKEGKPCGLFFKTNSITDKDVIEKIVEASQAGVKTTLWVRGISCIVPGVEGYTDNVRVVSIVGRLLEHSRIYGFGPMDDMKLYLSSADLMTRNMDKRIEIAWPLEKGSEAHERIINYINISMKDTVKLRELLPDHSYTKLGAFQKEGEEPFNSQEYLIKEVAKLSEDSLKEREENAVQADPYTRIPMRAKGVQAIIDARKKKEKEEE